MDFPRHPTHVAARYDDARATPLAAWARAESKSPTTEADLRRLTTRNVTHAGLGFTTALLAKGLFWSEHFLLRD